jgi:hypothetical protein
MAFDFPNAPTNGQVYQGYTWDGEKWVGTVAGPAALPPLMDGVAAVGVSVKYTREDHVHPHDTAKADKSYVDTQDNLKAPINSPAFTGTPRSPTPAAADNSDMIATTAFVKSNVPPPPTGFLPLTGGTLTGPLALANSAAIGTQGPAGQMIVNSVGNVDACVTFVRNGYFGVNFGISSDNNFYYGGWSFGGAAFRFWTTRDFASVPNTSACVTNARLVIAGDYYHAYNSAIAEVYNGGIVTGISGFQNPGAAANANGARYRYLQLLTTSWWSVAYG